MSARREEGRLPDGTAWRLLVPSDWDGVLVSDADLTAQPAHADLDRWCLDERIAVVRTSREPAAWQVERMLDNRRRVHELVAAAVGSPRVVIAAGESLGGMVSRAIAERAPELADAAVVMNGGGAGLIGLWNAKEDAGFALRELVGGAAGLPELLERAAGSAAGRARATLAAAFAMQPTWSDPQAPRPAPDDLDAQASAMRSTLGFGLAPGIRAEIERLAGGPFTGTAGVEYRALAARLGRRRRIVEHVYERAGLSLEDDLGRLDAASRTTPDADAVRWAESGSWRGHPRIPLVAVYAIGDPAAVPEEQSAYRAAAERGGGADRVEEYFLDAAGHCRFTTGERAAAISRALELVDGGARAASAAELQASARAADALHAERGGSVAERDAAYLEYDPDPYLRPHDLAGSSDLAESSVSPGGEA